MRSLIQTMKTHKIIAINFLVITLMLLSLIATIRHYSALGSHAGPDVNTFSGGVTEGVISCQTTSTQVVARNVHRQYLALVNTDASNSIDISLGNTATLGQGIRIGPNRSSYEINPENLFVGVVNCVAQNATATLQYAEK